tara:strand:+ start:1934 stop:2398 length:465 start_codon:yes stop_codon:yes gene_type:complete
MRLTKSQKEMGMMALAAIVIIALLYVFLPKAPTSLDAHEEEMEEEEEMQQQPASACTDCDSKQDMVGETDPSEILKGVKQGSMITYPESTRSIADSLYGVNRAEGICGRDTASNLDAALSRAKDQYEKQDCRVKRYYNMPAHLESAILGKSKIN